MRISLKRWNEGKRGGRVSDLGSSQLLLIALSARMLAQSAQRAGWRALVLDLFGDEDTCEAAQRCRVVKGDSQGLAAEELLFAARAIAPLKAAVGLVYGSGIDTRPALLARLREGRVLYGNEPEAVRLLRTPARFFSLLDRLAIPYPPTRFTPPDDPKSWLVKHPCSEGGKGVYPAAVEGLPAGEHYYQRRLPGPAFTALFLADGHRARMVGFNRMWVADYNARQPFLFAGAINRAELGKAPRRQIERAVVELVKALGLKGLNSLDFMLEDGICRVLEVNPRPGATVSLYDDDFSQGLLAEHIRACQGRPFDGRRRIGQDVVRAYKIVYAPCRVCVPRAIRWPAWSADRPKAQTAIAPGQPLCSVQAEGADAHTVERLVRQREIEMLDYFSGLARSA